MIMMILAQVSNVWHKISKEKLFYILFSLHGFWVSRMIKMQQRDEIICVCSPVWILQHNWSNNLYLFFKFTLYELRPLNFSYLLIISNNYHEIICYRSMEHQWLHAPCLQVTKPFSITYTWQMKHLRYWHVIRSLADIGTIQLINYIATFIVLCHLQLF